MAIFIQQVLNLLVSDAGSLTYHVVLAFSIAAALPTAILYWRSSGLDNGRRLTFGLALLLAVRLALFVSAGLTWQGLIHIEGFLPVMDRGATLLCLVLVVWLWAFPQTQRTGDAAVLLVGLLTITLSILGGVWWASQRALLPIVPNFNGLLPDQVAEISALVILAAGALVLLVRRPFSWGAGLCMLFLLAAGHLAHLLLPMPQGDYPAAVRLGQMAAFPLLILLTQRLPLPAGAPTGGLEAAAHGLEPAAPAIPAGRLPDGANLKDLQAYLNLAAESDPQDAYQAAAAAVARHMQADLCLLVAPPDGDGHLKVLCALNQESGEKLPIQELDARPIPVLVNAVRRGRALRVPAGDYATELSSLAHQLSIERTGSLLLATALSPDGAPALGVIVLSPNSERVWSGRDQSDLVALVRPLAQYLQHVDQAHALQSELEQVRITAQSVQSQEKQFRQERQRLLDQLTQMQHKSEQDRIQIESLASMISGQEQVHEQAARLQDENESLKSNAKQLEYQLVSAAAGQEAMQNTVSRLVSENASLQENAHQQERQMAQLNATLQDLQAHLQEVLAEQAALQSGKENFQQQEVHLTATIQELKAHLENLLAEQEALQSEIERLKGDQIQQHKELLASKLHHPEVDQIKGELRMAMEEVAMLQSALQQAETRFQALQAAPAPVTPEMQPLKAVVDTDEIISISHDLRQPLTSITGYTDFLLGESIGILGALQRKFLERIKLSTERMERMLDQLLQAANPSHVMLESSPEAIDLPAMVDHVLEQTRPQCEQKDLRLHLDIEKTLPLLNISRTVVQQILTGLLQNAAAVTPVEGDIHVRARLESTQGQPDYILLQISDTGETIARQDLPRAFSGLYRTAEGGGDLPLVKSLVESIAGRIWVDSGSERGATFSVLLPVHPVATHNGWHGQEAS